MENILVIGAGQLGSRHLQSIKKVQRPLNIFVVDPGGSSLQVAKQRYDEVPGGSHHAVAFCESLQQVTVPTIHAAVVATNSDVRIKVLEAMTSKFDVKNVLLEKILFDRLSDYPRAMELTQKKSVNCWANLCMRMQQVYWDMREAFRGQTFHYHVTGSQYGMVTNAIHYIDHACYLAGATQFSVDTTGLEKKMIPSKRKGFFELNGTMNMKFPNGSTATLTCHADGNAPVLIEVGSNTHRMISKENENKYLQSSSKDGWKWQELPLNFMYQSQLTEKFVNAVLTDGKVHLPTLRESIEIHECLFKPLHGFLKNSTGYTGEVEIPFT